MTDTSATADAEPAFELHGAERGGRVLIVCDHARNHVPAELGGTLGLPESEMRRHIAWDIGAEGVARALADALDAPLVLATFSRLVIDPNRGEDDPTLVMQLYDGTIIPGNRQVDEAEIERRLARWHRPYHAAIDAQIRRLGDPVLISIHSFTPRLNGHGLRPWHVGILHAEDERISAPLLARLRAEPDLVVGDNEPYSGELEGDTMWRHGLSRGLPHALIEIRHDLIETPATQRAWGERLAPIIAGAIRDAGLAAAAA